MTPDLQLFAIQQVAAIASGLFLLAFSIASLAVVLLISLLVELWRARK